MSSVESDPNKNLEEDLKTLPSNSQAGTGLKMNHNSVDNHDTKSKQS